MTFLNCLNFSPTNSSKGLVKRNPVHRAPSRLYRAKPSTIGKYLCPLTCVGPEFVVRSSLPSKEILVPADNKVKISLSPGAIENIICAMAPHLFVLDDKTFHFLFQNSVGGLLWSG